MLITVRSRNSGLTSGAPTQTGLLTEHVNSETGELMFIPWKTIVWGEITQKDPKSLFGEVNDFIAEMTEQEQNEIWDIFYKASEVIVQEEDCIVRDTQVHDLISKLFTYFDREAVYSHLLKYNVLIDPAMVVADKDLHDFIAELTRLAAHSQELDRQENMMLTADPTLVLPGRPHKSNTDVLYLTREAERAYAADRQRDTDYGLRAIFTSFIMNMGNNWVSDVAARGFDVARIRRLHERIMNPEYPPEQTYDEYDYRDLLVVLFYFKVATPIIGSYAGAVQDEVGTPFKELKTFTLFADLDICQDHVMDKLYTYAEAWATGKKGSKNAAYKYIATEDVSRYYVALICINRMPQFFIEHTGNTFMQAIFRFIKNKGNELDKGAPSEKDSSKKGGDEESDSVVEQYRISSKTASYIPDTMTVYLWGVGSNAGMAKCIRVAQDVVGGDVDVGRLTAYVNQVSSHDGFMLSPFHFPIFRKALGSVVYDTALLSVSRQALYSAVAITAYWLDMKGLHDIAKLVVAERTDMPLGIMEIGGLPLNPITPENLKALIALYPYTYQGNKREAETNPGVDFINETVKCINRYQWGVENPELIDIRNSIARLLLLGK